MQKFYLSLIISSLPLLTLGKVQISELTPCNFSSFINTDNYNFSGYIEFFNDGDSTNLEGCVLTHYKRKKKDDTNELKWQWTVTKNCPLPSNQYSILWMDEEDADNHAPYKLDKDGGYVTIRKNGELLDSIAYGSLAANISFGRKDGVSGYMELSPYKENFAAYPTISTRCKMPVLSVKGGVKTSPVKVSISCSTKNARVYYTLNGEEPTVENALLYESPIEISENTPLRAKAFADGMLSSKVVSTTYIFSDDAHSECGGFSVPIVSLVMDSAYFYDDTIGICVEGKNGKYGDKHCQAFGNYNQDWKRPVNFEYIVDENSVFSQDVEAAVAGGCSRAEFIKSLSLKASSKSGADEFDYNFFNSKPNVVPQTLHLRNGGTAYSKVRFRDGLMQTFAIDMNIDCQANQPVAYYVNGKYQGLMSLNERINADYIMANYGYKDDEIDFITVTDVKGVNASKGDLSAYNELVEYLKTECQDDSIFYEGACKRMDMDEYIDYQIFQQFIVNTDWPGNNTKIWREKKNGKFRWILFDTDFGLGLPGFENLGESDKNMINWCAGKSKKLHWANEESWMTEIFANLYQNKQFKSKFVTKYMLHLSSTFSEDNINAVFDSITTVLDAEYCAYSGGSSAVEDANSMRVFALRRGKDIYKQLVTYVEGSSLVNLSIGSDVDGAVFVVNGETMSKYNAKYIADYDLNIKVYPPIGYEFAGWTFDDKDSVSVKSEPTSSCTNKTGELNAILLGDVSVTANFIKSDFVPTVVLNEICSSSDSLSGFADDYGSYPDWIEIYNYGEDTLDLAGYEICLLKSNTKKKMSTLPYGSASTLINPGEHKVLWAKGDSLFGSLYLNFKIDMNDKPSICLVKDGNELDCVNVMKHATNESYGRIKDNDTEWKVFALCDNKISSTPGKENGSIICSDSDLENYLTFDNQLSAYPNPTSDVLVVTALQPIASLSVYDMTGRLIKSIEPNDVRCELNLSDCNAGIYYLNAQTIDGVYSLKVQKK